MARSIGEFGAPLPISTGFASWQHYCTASTSGRQPNFAALNRGRNLCSAGRPSRWALAHIPVFTSILMLWDCWLAATSICLEIQIWQSRNFPGDFRYDLWFLSRIPLSLCKVHCCCCRHLLIALFLEILLTDTLSAVWFMKNRFCPSWRVYATYSWVSQLPAWSWKVSNAKFLRAACAVPDANQGIAYWISSFHHLLTNCREKDDHSWDKLCKLASAAADCCLYKTLSLLVMVALCNRADHYIFILFLLLLLSFFSSPNLSSRRLDVYHTSAHGVVLV